MQGKKIAVIGATGLVGHTMIKVLEQRNFPIEKLYCFASARSKGQAILFRGDTLYVDELNEESFSADIDFALFAAGSDVAKQYAPLAKEKGIVVIDNSSAFRMDPNVPLVVPEVNPEAIRKHQGIIANPNCSTIQSVVPLGVLHKFYKIKRIVYSTYQAVSGSGVKGLRDLERGMKGEAATFYPHPIAYNCLPHIDSFLTNGYTKEEMKMIQETKKILNDDQIQVTATTVRVPIDYGHSIAINVELFKPFSLDEVKTKLSQKEGIVVLDKPEENLYPTPVHVKEKDEVYVGRIRRDESIANGLNLWVVADNIRKGAATNAVQIAELLLKEGLV